MIGLISDTHDNVPGIKEAVGIFNKNKCEFVIHAGDIVSGPSLGYFDGVKLKFILGNNVCLGPGIQKFSEKINAENLGKTGEINYKGKKIAVINGDKKDELEKAIKEQKYDYIITGHNHKKRDEKIGKIRIINPGGLYLGDDKKSFALLDIEKDIVEFVDIKQ